MLFVLILLVPTHVPAIVVSQEMDLLVKVHIIEYSIMLS
jgi:hypothetical protein